MACCDWNVVYDPTKYARVLLEKILTEANYESGLIGKK